MMPGVVQLRPGTAAPEVVAERARLAQQLGSLLRRVGATIGVQGSDAIVGFKTRLEADECLRLLMLLRKRSRR